MGDNPQVPRGDPWWLVLDGRYTEALEAYSDLSDPDRPQLNNRGTIKLLLGDYRSALEDFTQAFDVADPRYRSDGEYLFAGICHWYLGEPSAALERWMDSLSAPYTDAAGGVKRIVLLLYAAERLRDPQLAREMLGRLRRHRFTKWPGGASPEWPGTVVPFILGRVGPAELEERASSIPVLAGRRQCQAEFYIGLRYFREGERRIFEERMVRCAESGQYGLLEEEYYLARWEALYGFPDPAFTNAG